MSTKRKPIPPCACGKQARLNELDFGPDCILRFWVECVKTDCWSGPARSTAYEAINVWAGVMRLAGAVDRDTSGIGLRA